MKTIEQAITDYWCKNPAEMDELDVAISQGKARVLGTETERIVYAVRGENKQRHLVVWLGVSVAQDGLQRHTESMRKISSALGCGWFEFYTKRKGFIRIAPRLGFERMPDEEDGVMKFRLTV